MLERLTPAECVVFVLHDVFQLSFESVGSIVGRSPAACRQLASRARRHLRAESGPGRFTVESAEERAVAERFIAACAGGDLEALLRVLDPDVVGEVTAGPAIGARRPLIGRAAVVRQLRRRFGPGSGTTLVSLAVPGEPAVVVFRDGRVLVVLVLGTHDGAVHHIQALADPSRIG